MEGYLLLSFRHSNAYFFVHIISLRLPLLPRGIISILCPDFRCGKCMCLLSSPNSSWGDKNKKKKNCYFSPIASCSHIWLISFLIFNDISKEDFNPISSSLLPSSFPFLSLNKTGGGRELGVLSFQFSVFPNQINPKINQSPT